MVEIFRKKGRGIGDFQEVVFSEQFLCGAFVEIFPIRLGISKARMPSLFSNSNPLKMRRA